MSEATFVASFNKHVQRTYCAVDAEDTWLTGWDHRVGTQHPRGMQTSKYIQALSKQVKVGDRGQGSRQDAHFV